ncbi:hypothetical protein F4Y93_13630 [Candidatus Poribacteria bacterium]|nr:hypothetical protein [Candidatus Poribacteria bacterium]
MKKFYLPIGALLVAIVAIGMFALRSDTPKKPIKVYKTVTPIKRSSTPTTQAPVGETSQDGIFHAEPHSEVDTDDGSDEAHEAGMKAEGARSDAEYARKEALIEKLQKQYDQLKAEVESDKELDEMNAWLSENEDKWLGVVSELEPLVSLSVDEFHKRYPNLEENLYFLNRLLDLNDFRKEYVERTEGASELTRQRIYAEMESQGLLDMYRNTFLQEPEYIPFLEDFIVKYAPIDGGHE